MREMQDFTSNGARATMYPHGKKKNRQDLDSCLTPYTKVNARWTVDLSIKAAKTKQCLKENTDDKKNLRKEKDFPSIKIWSYC